MSVVKRTLSSVLSILNTGTGPNLVRLSVLPASLRKKVDYPRALVNLQSASKHKLAMLGVVLFLAKVGHYITGQLFVVMRNDAVEVILGCMYIDDHIEKLRIRPQ